MVSSAFGEDQTGSFATRLTVEDLRYLFMVWMWPAHSPRFEIHIYGLKVASSQLVLLSGIFCTFSMGSMASFLGFEVGCHATWWSGFGLYGRLINSCSFLSSLSHICPGIFACMYEMQIWLGNLKCTYSIRWLWYAQLWEVDAFCMVKTAFTQLILLELNAFNHLMSWMPRRNWPTYFT